MAGSLAELMVSIIGDVSDVKKAFDDVDKSAGTLGNSMTSLGNSMSSLGKSMSMYVTAPLAAVGIGAFKTAMDFDDSMRKVQAVTGETGETFEQLREAALQLGADTAFSSSQAADAMLQLGQAGFTADEILASTTDVLSLASAGALDLGTAAGITANAMQVFGIEAENTQRVVDVLAKGASISTTDIQGLGNALSYAGPVANALGMSLEETVSVLAALSNAGIEGERAGTALRGALDRLATPTDAMIAKFGKYKISLESVNPATHTFTEILDVLSSAGVEATDVMAIFGQEAGPGVLALLGQGTGAIKEQTLALQNSEGAAAKMAETMEGGVGGAWRQFTGSVETLSIVLGDLVAKGLTPVIDFLTRLLNVISGLPEPVMQVVVAVGALAAAIGPVLIVAGTLISSVGAITTAIAGAGGLSAALTTVVGILTGPVAIAIAAFAAAAYIVYRNWDTVGPLVQRTFDTIVNAVRPTAEVIMDFVNRACASLSAWWSTNGPAIAQAVSRVGEVLGAVFGAMAAVIWYFTSGPLKGLWEAFQQAVNIIIPILDYLGKQVGNMVMLVVNLINGDWSGAWTNARNIVSAAWEAIQSIVSGGLNAILGFHVSILNSIYSTIQNVWNSICSYISGAMNAISSSIASGWNNIQSAIIAAMGTISTAISGGWNAIRTLITGAMSQILTAVTSGWNNVCTAVTNAMNNINSGISTGWNTAKTIVSNGVSGIVSTVSSFGSSLYTAGANLVQSVINGIDSKIQDLKNKINELFNLSKSSDSGSSSGGSSGSGSSSSSSSSSGSSSKSSGGSSGSSLTGSAPTSKGAPYDAPSQSVKKEKHDTGGIAGYTGWHWMEKNELAVPEKFDWDGVLTASLSKALKSVAGRTTVSNSYGGDTTINVNATLTPEYDFERLMVDIERELSKNKTRRGLIA